MKLQFFLLSLLTCNLLQSQETPADKVIRGGSWHSGAMCIQTFYRNGLSSSWVDFAVGFRCVRSLK